MSVDAVVAAWDGTAAGAVALQQQFARELLLRDGFARPPRTVAGIAFAIGDGDHARAAIVVCDAVGGRRLQRRDATRPAAGDRDAPPAFRALPALLAAFDALPAAPDLALFAGHGIDHPRGLGSAALFALARDLPTIAVARRVQHGRGRLPHDTRGAYTALRGADGRQRGWLLRTDPAEPPLVVSPAHRVAIASAADLVMRFTGPRRIPPCLRLARAGTRRSTGDDGTTTAGV